jgi:hypothetical protein
MAFNKTPQPNYCSPIMIRQLRQRRLSSPSWTWSPIPKSASILSTTTSTVPITKNNKHYQEKILQIFLLLLNITVHPALSTLQILYRQVQPIRKLQPQVLRLLPPLGRGLQFFWMGQGRDLYHGGQHWG